VQRHPGSPTVNGRDAVGQRDRAAELLDEADALAHGHSRDQTQAARERAQVLATIAGARLKLARQLNRDLTS
jgi:hypothetical protein